MRSVTGRSGVGGMRGVSVTALLAACLAGAGVGGCSNERPVGMLQRDGDRAMREGYPSEAVEPYQEWVARQPQRAVAQHSLGMALLGAGRTSEAVVPLTVASDLEPASEEYFSDMARAMRQAGREQSLISTLRTNAQEKGRLVDWMRLGRNLMELGLMDEAHQAFTTAASIDAGRTVEPQLAFADLYHRLGRPEDELRRLRMAYYIDPRDERVTERLAALDVVPGPSLALPPEERP